MMYEEFNKILKELNPAIKEVCVDDFTIIERVYNYYPNFGDKIAAAKLYIDFGMNIFNDMNERASEMMEIEFSIAKLNSKIKELELERRKLIWGE